MIARKRTYQELEERIKKKLDGEPAHLLTAIHTFMARLITETFLDKMMKGSVSTAADKFRLLIVVLKNNDYAGHRI